MKNPRFTREELNRLEAGHEVEKRKYIYRIHGRYIKDSWHWVLQRARKNNEDWGNEVWEDCQII